MTGEIRWTPTEEQGPGSYPLIVQVTEQSPLAQTGQAWFFHPRPRVELDPHPPTAPDPHPVGGVFIQIQAVAADVDLPPQTLFYSIDGMAPAGASIDSSTGLITWSLPATPAPPT